MRTPMRGSWGFPLLVGIALASAGCASAASGRTPSGVPDGATSWQPSAARDGGIPAWHVGTHGDVIVPLEGAWRVRMGLVADDAFPVETRGGLPDTRPGRAPGLRLETDF